MHSPAAIKLITPIATMGITLGFLVHGSNCGTRNTSINRSALGDFDTEIRLSGRLRAVYIQLDSWGLSPLVKISAGKWLWLRNRASLARVEEWLRTVRRWPPDVSENALSQFGHRIVLVFADGRKEEIHTQGNGFSDCVWDGHAILHEREPFSMLLGEADGK